MIDIDSRRTAVLDFLRREPGQPGRSFNACRDAAGLIDQPSGETVQLLAALEVDGLIEEVWLHGSVTVSRFRLVRRD